MILKGEERAVGREGARRAVEGEDSVKGWRGGGLRY